MEQITIRQQKPKRLSRKTKNKIRITILNILIALSIICIIAFGFLVKNLSTDGLILAAIIDIPCAIFLIMICLANGVFDIPRRTKTKRPSSHFYNIELEKPKKKTHKPNSNIPKIERL